MRQAAITLRLSLPNNHVLTSIHPISCGPYMGHDVLMLMNNLCGKAYVVRSTVDGKHLSTSEMVNLKDGPTLVQNLIKEQGIKDCNTVTGNGQWGCD
jgi:hypothetical protein